jgi:hypothetical protein
VNTLAVLLLCLKASHWCTTCRSGPLLISCFNVTAADVTCQDMAACMTSIQVKPGRAGDRKPFGNTPGK